MLHSVDLFFVVIWSFVAITVAQQKCGPGWIQGNSTCYLLSDDQASHGQARDNCVDKNSHMAKVTSEDENNFLKSWLASAIDDSTEGVWLGATDESDDVFNFHAWQWVTDQLDWADFYDWSDTYDVQASRDGKCLSMLPQSNYSWDREDCDKSQNMRYVCEQDHWDLCKLPVECFQGSCYTLHCARKMAKLTDLLDYYGFNDGNLLEGAPDLPIVCPHGHLARIESKEESDFIKTFLSKAEASVDNVWIGGYIDDLEWKWQGSEEPITGFTDWNPVPPSYYEDGGDENGCIVLDRDSNWSWNNFDCSFQYRFLCEEAESSNSG